MEATNKTLILRRRFKINSLVCTGPRLSLRMRDRSRRDVCHVKQNSHQHKEAQDCFLQMFMRCSSIAQRGGQSACDSEKHHRKHELRPGEAGWQQTGHKCLPRERLQCSPLQCSPDAKTAACVDPGCPEPRREARSGRNRFNHLLVSNASESYEKAQSSELKGGGLGFYHLIPRYFIRAFYFLMFWVFWGFLKQNLGNVI